MTIETVLAHKELYTKHRLSPDGNLRWYVLLDVDIQQIVKSPLKSIDGQRYLIGDMVRTQMEWVFDESAAHKLAVKDVFECTSGYHPVFIETPGAPPVKGNEVVGFVISGDCIAVVDGALSSSKPEVYKTWLQRQKPQVVSTTTSVKSRLKTFQILNSKKNGTYEVVVYTDKTVSCPCKAWINRRECRHIRDGEVLNYIASL